MNSMEKGEIRNNTVGKGFQLCGMEHRSITLSINSTWLSVQPWSIFFMILSLSSMESTHIFLFLEVDVVAAIASEDNYCEREINICHNDCTPNMHA